MKPPTRKEIAKFERARRPALKANPSSKEFDRHYYDGLIAYPELYYGDHRVEYSSEQIAYCGRIDSTLVFAVYIGDEYPYWLLWVLGLSPNHQLEYGDSAYIFMPPGTGPLADATIALWCGDRKEWDSQIHAPMTDSQLALLGRLINS